MGLAPTTHRLITGGWESTAELVKKSEQLESDGLGGLPMLDLTFPGYG